MEANINIAMKIADGRNRFFQWDSGQRIAIYGEGLCNEVHFTKTGSKDALVCDVWEENGLRFANVPNILLQSPEEIKVYAYVSNAEEGKTLYSQSFGVLERNKPQDYVYTETEVRTYVKLEGRITALENRDAADPAVIAAGVRQYMQENPITPQQIGAVSVDQLPNLMNDTLAQARDSGEFNGEKGEKGDTGAAGPQGIRGEKGEKGDTGAAGPQGIRGEKGEKGDTGATGPQGIQGEKGEKGDTGATGATGPQGPKGDKGLDATPVTPLFAQNKEWLDANGDTAKFYVLPDGFLYAYLYKEGTGPLYTNLAGAVQENTRLNSSGVAKSGVTGSITTGFIPVKQGEVGHSGGIQTGTGGKRRQALLYV